MRLHSVFHKAGGINFGKDVNIQFVIQVCKANHSTAGSLPFL